MNFSEYTLLSVGDSFAFGQGTVQHPTFIQGISANSDDEQRQEWKKVCNSHSYVKHIEKELSFKQSINIAIPGCSDELSLINAEAWLNKNPKEKVFLLFSLTDPQRQIFFDKEKQVDFLNTFKYTSDKNLDYYYGILNNDISLTFKTYQFRKTLKRFIDITNIKHYIFSPRDNMDERIVKRRNHWNKTIDEGIDHWNKLGIADDFKNWLNNIEDEKTLGNNYLTINKLLTEKQELTVFDWLKKISNPLSSYDNHYNKEAHSTLGIFISEQIRQNNA
jgi:hypothetical protein